MNRTYEKLAAYSYWALLTAAILATLVVFLLRIRSVLEVDGLLPTVGVEGPGALGIYNVCAHKELYNGFNESPNVFVFNFIFYELYGLVVRAFGSCAIATPYFGRLLTATLVAVLGITIFAASDKRLHAFERASIAIAVFSPCIGWWAFALRPDVGASVFFIFCILTMLAYLRGPKLWLVLLSAFFLVCSWGFKQPFIFAAPVLLLYVFWKDMHHAVVFAFVLAVGIAAPFVIYGWGPYFSHTIGVQTGTRFGFDIGISNFLSFLSKAAPVLVLAIMAIVGLWQGRLLCEKSFLPVMLIFSLVVFGVAAAKLGASDNYYFPTFVILLILAIRNVWRCGPRARRLSMAAYAILSIISAVVITAGYRGTTSLDTASLRRARQAATKLNRMPNPKLVWGEVVALPWFTHEVNTRALWYGDARPLIKGGFDLRKTVAEQYYKTIAVEGANADNLDLSGYRLSEAIGNIKIYVRRQ